MDQNPVARVGFDAPRSKRTDEQKRALIELMLAHDPAYKADFKILPCSLLILMFQNLILLNKVLYVLWEMRENQLKSLISY